MPRIEKTSIALLPEVVELVRDAVDTSEYASSSEVIPEALPDWPRKGQVQDALKENGIAELRQLWLEARSDKGLSVDPEGVLDRLERNYQAMTGAIEAAK